MCGKFVVKSRCVLAIPWVCVIAAVVVENCDSMRFRDIIQENLSNGKVCHFLVLRRVILYLICCLCNIEHCFTKVIQMERGTNIDMKYLRNRTKSFKCIIPC